VVRIFSCLINWTTIAWPVGASAYLSLAIVHLVIWCKQTDQRVHLLFSVTALSTAASAIGVQTGRMRPEVAAALVHQKRWQGDSCTAVSRPGDSRPLNAQIKARQTALRTRVRRMIEKMTA
jgi:hypothetical protein